MSRKRLRPIVRGQGWVEAPASQLGAIRDAIVSDQPENTVSLEGKVRVHALEPFPPRPGVQRVNLSGEVDVQPIGAVRRR